MNVKRIAALVILLCALAVAVAGCGLSTNFLGQAEPTSPPTRTPRPTFTPRPQATNTPEATDTPEATATTAATDTPVPPTKKPVVPTAKPKPTQPPAPPPAPTQPPPPTTPPYAWSYASQTCEHSGGVYIHIRAYESRTDPNSNIDGVRTRVSWEMTDSTTIGDVTTSGGNATYVLSPDSAPPKTGTFYAWIIDSSGKRISNYSAPIVLNAKGEDAPDTCWQAYVNFVKN